MEKIIHSLISNWIKGVDTYTHNGSTWLIFTDSRKWVVELTESKTLWYNYNFFKQIFEFTSLDVVGNQQYITKWVEDNVINKVSDIHFRDARDRKQQFEDTLENGVRHTEDMITNLFVEDTLQNGVKHTEKSLQIDGSCVIEDTVQNGVKETSHNATMFQSIYAEDAIQNGVKRTQDNPFSMITNVENAIQNGVKHTEIGWHQCNNIDDAIEYGVKETLFNQGHKQLTVKNVIENGVIHTLNTEYTPKSMVVDIIENGVKSSIPRQYVGKDIIDKVIDKGVIETHREICEYKHTVEHIIQTGVKETHDDVYHHKGRIDGVIKNGVKKTSPLDPEFSVRFIDGDENNDWEKVPNINEVIDNGVKETKHANRYDSIGPVFKEGKIENVIENGDKLKNPTG
jgi:hypothetical protein